MKSHVIVGEHDLTNYIVNDSYEINAKDVFESWKDGNMVEHRVIVSTKVEGSFEIVCSDRGGDITLATFLGYWNEVVNNGVATIGVYVPSKDTTELIECYFSIDSSKHIKDSNDNFVDVLKITIKER